jgi:SAM-dependent methyltransferase
MKLLNVGCGGQRPGPPWTNLDTLRQFLKEGTPERINLDGESNYVECDLLTQSIPFKDEWFDGILLQHVLEHFTCHQAVDVLMSCRRVLRKGGLLVASVPNTDYFVEFYDQDTRANAVPIFGESISGDLEDARCEKFFDYALFHREHKQLLTPTSLLALFLRSGFPHDEVYVMHPHQYTYYSARFLRASDERDEIRKQLNRPKFSTLVGAYK